ncbi:hypothetical protein QFC24_002475 [Naganishia onofrii]|uniref:Uncharacterized protein n=1 Tax=Naganishia onofrii TaxID=1851511 RepID=A0ACC2XQH4_9TREE|nr:hypothetical protein QFC24_002475 [Naganishia onofrii]
MPSTSKPKAKPRRRRRDDDEDQGGNSGGSDSDSPASASGSDGESGSESDAAEHESGEESDGSDSEAEADVVEDATLVEPAQETETASAEPIETVTFDEFNIQETDAAPQAGNKKPKKDKKQRAADTRPHEEPTSPTKDTTSSTTAQSARPRPASNRAAYLAKIAADPTFVPRVGKFWTHDERHYAAGRVGQGGSEYAGLREMSDYWRERRGRGRGGFGFAPRGGVPVRGRGRGGAVQGREQSQAQTQPQQKEEPATVKAIADDNAEATQSSEPPSSESKQETAIDPTSFATAQPAAPPAAAQNKTTWTGETGRSDRGSWSHDGYAELAREEERRSAARERQQQMMMARGRGRGMVRGMFRGRGRGRGGFVHPGGVMQPVEQMVPVAMAAGTQLSGPEVETITAAPALPPTSTADIQPIVKLPGSDAPAPPAAVHETNPANPPISDHEPSAITAHLQTQAEHAEHLQQQELKRKQQSLEADMHRLEIGQHRVDSTGMAPSDAGSQGSSAQHHHSGPPPPNMLPPGIGVAENGAFFDLMTGQAVVWVPSPSPGPAHSPISVGSSGSRMGYNPYAQSAPGMNMGYGYQQPPQSYYGGYPNAYGGYERPPHPADPMNYAAYSPSFMPGRDSGSPYAMQGYGAHVPPQLGDPSYFMPPRPQSKIEIRAPTSGNAASSPNQYIHSAEIAAATLKDPSKHGASSPDSTGYSQDNPYSYQAMSGQYDQATRQGYYPQQYMPMGY